MNPTSEAAAKLERAWEAYYEQFDLLSNELLLVQAMMEPIAWQERVGGDWRMHSDTKIAFQLLVENMPAEARIALLVGYDLIPSFEKWSEETP